MKCPIIIIGMHRSGTSYLSRVLMNSGVFMGEYKDNNNESLYFKNTNDILLKLQNHSWDDPVVISHSTYRLNHNISVAKHFGSYKKPFTLVNNIIRKKEWGWKDPRNTFTLPYWLRKYPNAKVIHIYRNGKDVARSLYIRNRGLNSNNPDYSVPMENPLACFELWEKYVNQGFKNEKFTRNIIHVKYEALTKGEKNEISKLESFIDMDVSQSFQIYRKKETTRKELDEIEFVKLRNVAIKNDWMKRLGYV